MSGDKETPRLTGYTKFSGCGAKLGPGLLDRALCNLSQADFPELLVDFKSADDAGVWKIDDKTALVQTVDFFPPIVDDPFLFGRIAAANALSDVYAMGGRPITALSIMAFPTEKLDIEILRRISEGALDALAEAGAALVGGHSIKDDELKFGLAVSGLVHPEKALRNNRPRPGEVLVLTKALGTGCINRALKAGRATGESIDAANRSMAALNRRAAEVLSGFPVSACTDVTGFGLAGHLCEMMVDSGCGISLEMESIETLPGVTGYIADGLVPGGTFANREFRERWIRSSGKMSENTLNLLFDPQTSGGLLASLPEESAGKVIEALGDAGVTAFVAGHVTAGDELITVS